MDELEEGEKLVLDYENMEARLLLPIMLASAGIFCSAAGVFAVSTKEEGQGWNSNLGALMWGLEKGMYSAVALFVVAAVIIMGMLFGFSGEMARIFFCILAGLFSGVLIGKATEYFTSFDFGPVISIKDRGVTGPATVVIQGTGVGMISCAPTTVLMVACIMGCAALDGAYGADIAGGLAEMDPSIGPEVRLLTDSLDALGNTTA